MAVAGVWQTDKEMLVGFMIGCLGKFTDWLSVVLSEKEAHQVCWLVFLV